MKLQLFQDIALYFKDRQDPNFVLCDPPEHGRIEIRKTWTTTELNDYLNFPHLGQAFVVQRESTDKKSDEYSCEIAYCITSRTPEQADPKGFLPLTVVTGALKTAAITLSIGTMTKTAAAYAVAMARKTLPDCAVLPLASSSSKVSAIQHKKCDSSLAMYAWFLTTCG